jgi:hypothetical protein
MLRIDKLLSILYLAIIICRWIATAIGGLLIGSTLYRLGIPFWWSLIGNGVGAIVIWNIMLKLEDRWLNKE